MGPIPRSINKTLSTLTEVLFLNNMLTGCLPLEIGFLKEAGVFDVGNNRLTGPIPFSLGCLEKVEELNFAGKLFYGMVPEVLCQLPNLLNLSLYDNYFMQVGLACRSLIWKGLLDIRKNCIPDLPFQRSVAECADLFQYPRFCPYMNSHSLQASASWFSGFFDSLKWLLSLVILFSCKPLWIILNMYAGSFFHFFNGMSWNQEIINHLVVNFDTLFTKFHTLDMMFEYPRYMSSERNCYVVQ